MTVGVVGASARAAVCSLARAGLSAWAVDQFNDRDLARVAPCALCPEGGYPSALPDLAARFPPGPVLYTGGLENHPRVVAELARTRELWGNPPEVLARVRDPFALAALLARIGFRVPRLVPPGEACPAQGRWLRKPVRSGGGLGVRFARAGAPATPDHVFQEFIDGAPMSALYCGTTLLGTTEQLIGAEWLHAAPFAYCGNVGPLEPPAWALRLGRSLCTDTGLREHWGADLVLRDGEPWVLEVNPRYTAAIEVLELATGRAAFGRWLPANRPGAGVVGKAVYYAPHAIRFPRGGPWDADLAAPFDPWRVPGFADIPDAGARVEVGWPVLTLFAEASSSAEARRRLQSRAAELDSLFAEHRP